MPTTKRMSPSLEDYLEMIYELCISEGSARLTDLAVALGVSKPSANQAIALLSEQGYIDYQKYRPILMTDKGKEAAKAIFKNHNLIKDFFIKSLGLNAQIAEKDACKMEHILSEETLRAIKEYMKRG